jgi:PilZ domain
MPATSGETHANQPVERRLLPRYRFYLDIEIAWQSKVLRGRASDFSEDGMFIELRDRVVLSTCFSGRLALDAPLHVECVVRRIDHGKGIGVSIVIPDEENKIRYRALLRALQRTAGPSHAGAHFAAPAKTIYAVASSLDA